MRPGGRDYYSNDCASKRLLLQLEALVSTFGDIVTTIDDLIMTINRFGSRLDYSLIKDPEHILMPSHGSFRL
jgi:hypothetical protein